MRNRSIGLARSVAALSAMGLVFGLSNHADAANAYFDVNGATAGYGVVNGGSYSWDDANWAAATGGTSATGNWVQGDFARFPATGVTSYTVTVNGDEQNAGLYMNVNGVTLTINAAGSGTLNVLPSTASPPVQGFFGGTGATIIINAPISGTGGIQPQNGGNIYLNGVNTYSGGTKLTSTATLVYFNNDSSFGSGNISIAVAGFVPLLGTGGATITLPNNFTNTIANGGINFAASANTPVVSSGTWSLGANNLQLRNNGPTTSPLTLSNVISGSGNVTLSANNSGTIIFSGANTYSGITTVGRGNTAVTLKLGAANTIASNYQVTMAGGILKPNGLNHNMTNTLLGLTVNSTIDSVDGASEVAFKDSSAVTLTAGTTLNPLAWNPPSTRLRFGTNSSGLTAAQLAQISNNGTGLGTAVLDSDGYLVFPTGGPVITVQPVSPGTLCQGTSFTLTVGATSSGGTLSYQWYRNNAVLDAETGSSLTLTAGTPNAQNGDQYHAVVTDSNGSSSSSKATLGVYASPTISVQPFNRSVAPGATVTFAVTAASNTTPATLNYQWYRSPSTVLPDGTLPNGTAVSGATTATLTLADVHPADSGSYYVQVTDACAVSSASLAGTLTIVPQLCLTHFDADDDTDVDQNDFGLVQACYTGGLALGDKAFGQCNCFDVSGTANAVDEEDLMAFQACASDSGPEIAADEACAGSPVLFSETFDTDHASLWQVNKSVDEGLSHANDAGSSADFFFDYSTLGIPPAPHSTGGTTRGLVLKANLTGNLWNGLSVSPIGQSFTGDYTLQFDLWTSYTGPLSSGFAATSYYTSYGIMSDGITPEYLGATAHCILLTNTNDGNLVSDFRAVTPSSSTAGGFQDPGVGLTSPVYAANTRTSAGVEVRNSGHPYYSFLGGATAPAAQLALFPSLTGTTPVGSTGFAWRNVKLVKKGTNALWYIDDHLIARIDLATAGITSGNNIVLAQGDSDSTSPTDPLAATLDFALFDNVHVKRN